MTLTLLKNTSQSLCKIPLNLRLSVFSSYPNQIMNFWQGYHNCDTVSLFLHHTGEMVYLISGDVGFDHLVKIVSTTISRLLSPLKLKNMLWRDTSRMYTHTISHHIYLYL